MQWSRHMANLAGKKAGKMTNAGAGAEWTVMPSMAGGVGCLGVHDRPVPSVLVRPIVLADGAVVPPPILQRGRGQSAQAWQKRGPGPTESTAWGRGKRPAYVDILTTKLTGHSVWFWGAWFDVSVRSAPCFLLGGKAAVTKSIVGRPMTCAANLHVCAESRRPPSSAELPGQGTDEPRVRVAEKDGPRGVEREGGGGGGLRSAPSFPILCPAPASPTADADDFLVLATLHARPPATRQNASSGAGRTRKMRKERDGGKRRVLSVDKTCVEHGLRIWLWVSTYRPSPRLDSQLAEFYPTEGGKKARTRGQGRAGGKKGRNQGRAGLVRRQLQMAQAQLHAPPRR
ncbi:hypothetical protein CDD83_4127 [Cordyceps sp. RAO-2017]|nr:hypothetical protein CDD83_4127 [Cordyceps sp. RAO-2017]